MLAMRSCECAYTSRTMELTVFHVCLHSHTPHRHGVNVTAVFHQNKASQMYVHTYTQVYHNVGTWDCTTYDTHYSARLLGNTGM